MAENPRNRDIVAATFRKSRSREFAASPLYAVLSSMIAEDGVLIDLACQARPGQSAPMLFTAATRFVALQTGSSDLDDVFLGRIRADDLDRWFPQYRSFVLDHAQEIRSLVARRSVAKNEIRRCACLRALLVAACKMMEWRRVHIVDVGCSVGLNLLLDRFDIAYRPDDVLPSAPDRTIGIHVISGEPPEAPVPEIVSRSGIDIEFLDPDDASDRNWILSNILPEDADQFGIMEEALGVLAQQPPTVHVGDASALVGEVARNLSEDVPILFMHSMALHQFDLKQKQRFRQALQQLARQRPCARISMELAGDTCQLRISAPRADSPGLVAGTADMDAHWMTWDVGEPTVAGS